MSKDQFLENPIECTSDNATYLAGFDSSVNNIHDSSYLNTYYSGNDSSDDSTVCAANNSAVDSADESSYRNVNLTIKGQY